MNFEKHTYEHVSRTLSDAIQWIQSFGISTANTRLERYVGKLRQVQELLERGELGTLKDPKRVSLIMSLFNEISDIEIIYNGLCSNSDSFLGIRLADLVGGPDLVTNERNKNASNKPRCVAFELVMAAILAASGFEIDLSKEPDVRAFDGSRQILVECKRPNSNKKIKSNIKTGLQQLTRSYDGATPGYGLLAISIDKLVNPNNFVLPAPHADALCGMAQSHVRKFIIDNKQFWHRNLDHRTIGVIVSLKCQGLIEYQRLPTNVHVSQLYLNGPLNGSVHYWIAEFYRAIELGQQRLLRT